MQRYTNASSDLRLLDLRGLTPLNLEMAGGELDLRGMLESHNNRCARASSRLRQLIEDRRRLGDFDAWKHKGSSTLLAERARLRSATWDALLELRHVLEEREHVLTEVEQRLREQYYDADRAHDQAITATEKRLARERRRLERTNPATAGSHFAEIVEADASVQAAAERSGSSRRAFEDTAQARRNLSADLRAVTMRQREVFAVMVG